MAINVPQVNPRLANIQAPNLPRINVGGAIESGVNLGQRLQGIREQDQLQSLVQEQGQAALGGDQDALNQIALQGPDGAELAGSLQQIVASRNEQQVGLAQRQIKKQGTFLASLVKAKPEVQRRKIFEQANKLLGEGDRERGAEFLRISQLKDPLEIQGEIESGLVLSQSGDKFLQSFLPQAGGSGSTRFIGTPQRIVKDGKAFLSGIVQGPDGSFGIEDVEVGGEFVDVQGLTASKKVQQAGDIAEAQAKAKAKIELATEPEIAKSVAVSRKAGVTEADDRETLANLESNLPNLERVVGDLRELSPLVSSTLAGRGFDLLSKELGFGVSEGGDARAKYVAIVANEVLPLLRDTFGSAFTEGEGQRLLATLGDVNSTQTQRDAQLDAFIEGKLGQIEVRRKKLGIESVTKPSPTSVITELSDEDLFK